MNKKYCLRCEKELIGRKKKFCNSHCSYWYHQSNKVSKGWGSKNSQIRLDKANRSYSKRIRSGKNVARYL